MLFGREPALWLALLGALIALGIGFGLKLDGTQVSLIMAAATAAIGFIIRTQVTPNQNVATQLVKTGNQVTVEPGAGASVASVIAASPAGAISVEHAKKIVVLFLAVCAGLGVTGCGARYAPGVPVQSKFAYELEQTLSKLHDVQVKLIAQVDAGATTPAIANRFLDPIKQAAQVSKDEIMPRLRAYDAAVTLADRDRLKGELKPLLVQFNALIGQAFGAQLPDNVIGSLAKLAEEVRSLYVGIRTEFALEGA